MVHLKNNPPRLMVRGGINVISVDDVVLGLRNACRYGKSGERYLLCGENISYEHFCELCGKAGGFESPKLYLENEVLARIMVKFGFGRDLSIDCLEGSLFEYVNRYFYYNPKKSWVELHLPPTENLETTIKNTYHWYEENA